MISPQSGNVRESELGEQGTTMPTPMPTQAPPPSGDLPEAVDEE